MSKESGSSSSENDIVKIFSVQCEKCSNLIEVPIRKSDIESASGGIFRIVVVHQCTDERLALFLFFDKHLTLRQKVVNQISASDLQETQLSDRKDTIPLKEYSTYKFLFRKLGPKVSQLIFGVLIGQQIIFFGDATEAKPSVNAMTLFSPHRFTLLDEWNEERSDADIIGTTENMVANYPDALIIDLTNRKIRNGFENNFCQELVAKLDEINDPEKAKELIDIEITSLQKYIQEYVSVQSSLEAETFYSALALDGVKQSNLEIILPISTQLNPFIADYYYNERVRDKSVNFKSPIPSKLRFFDKKTSKSIAIPLTNTKNIIHFRENTIAERCHRAFNTKSIEESIFEFVTTSNHFISILKDSRVIVLQYPRKNNGLDTFIHALAFLRAAIEFSTKEYFEPTIYEKLAVLLPLLDQVGETVGGGDIDIKEIRENLPLQSNHSVLERHYRTTTANAKDLRLFITKIIDRFSFEFPNIQPKVISTQKLTFLRETLKDVITNDSNQLDKIDINFNIVFYSHSQEMNNKLDIIFEFYIDQTSNQIGLDSNLSFSYIYEKFNGIFNLALEDCQKSNEFIGLKREEN